MSLNSTPKANRVHIAFFGKTNAGKSSLINAVTNQNLAIVSKVRGTTTDPVYKSMELLPIGPVTMIDTAGLCDEGELGTLREEKTLEVLNKTDIAVVVFECSEEADFSFEVNLVEKIKNRKIPVVPVLNKNDLVDDHSTIKKNIEKSIGMKLHSVSALKKQGIEELKNFIGKLAPEDEDKFKIIGDLISPGDFVVLVTPIDKAAPKGRLILPQQQTIRDILESDAMAIVTKEHELRDTLNKLGTKPKMVVTDSQAFLKVSADTPDDILMTSFSILFARHKGDLNVLVKGARKIDDLEDGDKILIAEGCTHHRQTDDIGTVKIPRWLRQMTGKDLEFHHVSGVEFTKDVEQYGLIVHCGGCMLNHRAMGHRIDSADGFEVPIVNYGVLIAYVHGILDRALEPFPLAKMIWEKEA
ncbi:[FeFe] hydrogenase H-cluster maturation GTPase HydF [Alkalibacter saccharofermentans]|uniref:Iron-only hydrogenase maturation protein HydF n=1 Tax=Alkalibacter saccharofermentans DSM 14828 TaxID=1120975 RepID=A0A1M4SCQ5_9FIRM|nr:[FeFe] hydrogenase H-cluster maturation GTPase HydF [Alkalibacter saccharofermentans]SHE29938.1 iron-only hydrogenase maturation protein HydF [Alkalibacter saccharofermentans DSM 14828]